MQLHVSRSGSTGLLLEVEAPVLLHAGIVQEANLSMVHLASNKSSEQHTLWQVGLSRRAVSVYFVKTCGRHKSAKCRSSYEHMCMCVTPSH